MKKKKQMAQKPAPAGPRRVMLLACGTTFLASACIMILELVAGRLLAKYLGSTLYVWTSVIGVVLGGITLGNYSGGRLADKYPPGRSCAVLFGIASLSCVTVVLFNHLVGGWTWLWQFPWPLRVFTHVALVFFLPSAVLGTISPVVAKMALSTGLPQGSTIGKVYAWGAAGSILGTFLAGFVLISALGTVAIIWGIAAVLLVMALFYALGFGLRLKVLHFWTGLFLLLFLLGTLETEWAATAGAALGLREKLSGTLLYEDESNYCYIAVEQLAENPDLRRFRQDDLLTHSKILYGDIKALQSTYIKIFAAVTHLLHPPDQASRLRSLFIGGGGYVMPRYLEETYPGSRLEVAELDPGVTEAAMQAFGLSRETTIRTINLDARNYVSSLLEKAAGGESLPAYDVIYGDAFDSSFVPFQLVTLEFHAQLARLLAPGGVYMVNLIDVYDEGRFLGAVLGTLQQTFPHVAVVSTFEPAFIGRNFVVIASQAPLELSSLQADPDLQDRPLWFFDRADISRSLRRAGFLVLRDDYAPVEQKMSPLVEVRSRLAYARIHLEEADSRLARGDWQGALVSYEAALQGCPELTIYLCGKISAVQGEHRNWQAVIAAGRRAIEYNSRREEKIPVGDFHYNLGLLLLQEGRQEEGVAHLRSAVREFPVMAERNPRSAGLQSNWGDALAYTGDYAGAVPHFTRAVELDPFAAEIRLSLSYTLMTLGQDREARRQLSLGIRTLEEAGLDSRAGELAEVLTHYEDYKAKLLAGGP